MAAIDAPGHGDRPRTAEDERARAGMRQALEHVSRQSALALFDAFASKDKTLPANPGDHRTIRWTGVDDGFLARHLGQAGAAS